MYYVKFLIVAMLLAPGLLIAQDTLTLGEAIQTGLANNYNIQIAAKDRAIDRNNVHLGNAGFLPTLRLNATQTNSISNTNQEYISGETINRTGAKANDFNARAELRWTLFDGLAMFTTHDKLKEIRERGQQKFRETVLATIRNIMARYYEIARQKQKRATLQEALALSRKRREIARTSYKVGSGSKQAYMQARVDYNSDTSRLMSQQQAIEAAKIRLNELMGRAVDDTFNVKDSIPLQEKLNYGALRNKMLDANPSLNIAEQNRRISNLEKKNVQAQRFPEIGLQAGYDYAWSQSEAGFVSESQNNGFDYGLYLSYPLFDGFNINRQKQNAEIAIERSNLAYEQTRQKLRADLKIAYTKYANHLSRVKLEEENLDVARKNYEIAQESYKSGNTSYLEAKEAQTKYLEARERLTNARYKTKNAEIELLKLSGQILDEEGME